MCLLRFQKESLLTETVSLHSTISSLLSSSVFLTCMSTVDLYVLSVSFLKYLINSIVCCGGAVETAGYSFMGASSTVMMM